MRIFLLKTNSDMSIIKKVIDQMRPGEDFGLDHSGKKGRQRSINPDGSYNLERRTGRLFGNFYLFNRLVTTSWKHYWLAAIAYYIVMNILFALL